MERRFGKRQILSALRCASGDSRQKAGDRARSTNNTPWNAQSGSKHLPDCRRGGSMDDDASVGRPSRTFRNASALKTATCGRYRLFGPPI